MFRNLKDITNSLVNLDKSLSSLETNYSEKLLIYISKIEQDLTEIIDVIEPLNNDISKKASSIKHLVQLFNQQGND